MNVAVGVDHGGFALKADLVTQLRADGHEVIDCGAMTADPGDDYPDFAVAVARAVVEGQAHRGIVVCGSGVGAAIAANKVPGARACVCHDSYSARQGVEHDDLNILCLGGRVIGPETAAELVRQFTAARFTAQPRHLRRLAKVKALDAVRSPPPISPGEHSP